MKNKILVRFLRNKGTFSKGDEYIFEKKVAEQLVSEGYAEKVIKTKNKSKTEK